MLSTNLSKYQSLSGFTNKYVTIAVSLVNVVINM